MRVKEMTEKEGELCGISRNPSIHGQVDIESQSTLLVRCGGRVYDVTLDPDIYLKSK